MLIRACLNGATSRSQHPSVPQTPGELAAGAVAAVTAVRAAVPAAPVGVTTGLWAVGGDPGRRMARVSRWTGDAAPDFASVNLSEPGADELAEMLGDLARAAGRGSPGPGHRGRLGRHHDSRQWPPGQWKR
jgi:uncharacterized protein (DUF849 family)